jgi:hypothetical protein
VVDLYSDRMYLDETMGMWAKRRRDLS